MTACSGQRMIPIRLPSGVHDPDAARSGAIDPADAVDLQPVGDARLAALVQVGEDAAPDHVAGGVELDRVDVLRRARIRDVHRALVRRQRQPVRVFAMRQHAQAAVRRQTINAGAVPQIVFAFRSRYLALVIGAALVRIGEIQTAVRVADHVVGPVEPPAFVVVDQRFDLAVRTHPRQACGRRLRRRSDGPARSKVVPLPPIVVLTSSGSLPGVRRCSWLRRRSTKYQKPVRMPERAFGKDKAGRETLGFGGFEHVGQIIVRRPSSVSPFLAVMPRRRSPPR